MNNKSVSKLCANCGGKLKIDPYQEIVECPYCGTNHSVSELLGESDKVQIERIKLKTYKDMEASRQQFESENLKYEIEMEKNQCIKENIFAFKKSKFKILLILFTILSILFCALAFNNKTILPGIIAIIMTIMFIVSYLMGMQIIKAKNHNLYILPAIIGFILIVPYFITRNHDLHDYSEKLIWSDIELCEILPNPDSKKAEIYENSKTALRIDVLGISNKEYNDYIDKCKERGFTIDVTQDSISFDAYNEDGFKLGLMYYKGNKEMSIDLETPMEMVDFKWPNSEIVKLLPVPKSNKGQIEWESDDGFTIYVGETTIEDYKTYIEECSDNGFIVDYEKGDNYYYADNVDGYHLSLKYEGNNIMFIRIEKSDDKLQETNPTDTSKSTEGTTGLDENNNEKISADGISPEFKEAMDSYEAFFDEYVAFMKKYNNASSEDVLGMISDYNDYLRQCTETMEKIEAIDEDELSAEEALYLSEVSLRISQKLAEVQ